MGPRAEEQKAAGGQPNEFHDSQEDGGGITEQDQARNAQLQKNRVQMQYLESENQNLQLENTDLNETLKINKDIIKNLLTGDKKYDQ